MTLRRGTPSDIDAVTGVIIETMPQDPQWNYRFPWRDQYPEDHYKYTRMLIKCFLEPAYPDWEVMVIEHNEQGGKQIVSFAVWNISYINKKKNLDYKARDRKYPLAYV